MSAWPAGTGTRRATRGRPIGLAGGMFLLLLSGFTGGCDEPEIDPVTQRLQAIADPRAARAVAKMLEAYGGYPAWRQRRNVEYSYRLRIYGGSEEPQYVTHQLHRLGLDREVQVYVEDLDVANPQVVRLDAETVAVVRDGQPVEDPALLEFPRAFGRVIRWTFRTPWTLLDPASQLEGRADRTPNSPGTVPVGPCDVVRLRFTESTPGGKAEDWHDFYISKRSGLVEQVHSYRAEDDSYRLAIWSDHRTFDGVRVAMRRETFASNVDAEIGRLEAVAEYEEVRFDAPFDEEIFRDAVSLAAPADHDTSGR